MGIDTTFAGAYAKACIAAGLKLPRDGKVFITMNDKCKKDIIPIAKTLVGLGYQIVSTGGTAAALKAAGVPCEFVLKIHEGRPNPTDLMRNGEIKFMMMTSSGDALDLSDGKDLRRLALGLGIPNVSTIAGCAATTEALKAMKAGPLVQIPIQDYFPDYYDNSVELIYGARK
ncbi:hypothetical protein FOA52_008950 [Chlamydomonas sp. UWO 241]|nr:hypothetical protein FOA52_008950 [Chlamydomonas sp. UWO 241]